MNDFKTRYFSGGAVLCSARRSCEYGLIYPDLKTMIAEQGLRLDRVTFYAWVQRYAPEIEMDIHCQWSGLMSDSGRFSYIL